MMQTRELAIRTFEDVPKTFAPDEGEGDGSLEWYWSEHTVFYHSGEGRGEEAVPFGDGTGKKVFCERFEIIWLVVPMGLNDERE